MQLLSGEVKVVYQGLIFSLAVPPGSYPGPPQPPVGLQSMAGAAYNPYAQQQVRVISASAPCLDNKKARDKAFADNCFVFPPRFNGR